MVVLRGTFRVVDLSLVVSEELPSYWPTHLPFQHKTWCWFAELETPVGRAFGHLGPYTTRWLLMDEHTGTHFDAPRHFLPPPGSGLPNEHPLGAVTAEHVPLEQLMGPARVMDVRDLIGTTGPGTSPEIDAGPPSGLGRRDGGSWRRRCPAPAERLGFRYRPGIDGAGYVRDVIVTRTGQRLAGAQPGAGAVRGRAGCELRRYGCPQRRRGAGWPASPRGGAGCGAGLPRVPREPGGHPGRRCLLRLRAAQDQRGQRRPGTCLRPGGGWSRGAPDAAGTSS